jgi:hypothetical protein
VKGSHLAFFNDGDVKDLRDFVRGAYERAGGLFKEER